MSLLKDLASPVTSFHTWWLMANQDTALRYRRSVIGPFWISISTAVMVFGIGHIYASLQGRDAIEFLPYVGCGMTAWILISSLVLDSCQVVLESDHFLRSVRLPIPILAARMVQRNMVMYLHHLLVIGVMLALPFINKFPTFVALLAIPGLLLYAALGFMLALGLGPLCTRFRDLAQVVGSAVQFAFFMTPIFWDVSHLPETPIFVDANPLHHLIEIVRAPMLGAPASALSWGVSLACLAVATAFGLVVLSVSRQKIFTWL